MPSLMFRCPNTGMNVPLTIPFDSAADAHALESVGCPACGRLHFVNKSTGKPLGVRRLEFRHHLMDYSV